MSNKTHKNNLLTALGLTLLIALGCTALCLLTDAVIGHEPEFLIAAFIIGSSAAALFLWTALRIANSEYQDGTPKPITSVGLKELRRHAFVDANDLFAGVLGSFGLASLTGGTILFIWCLVGWTWKARESWAAIHIGNDTLCILIVSVASGLILIFSLKHTSSKYFALHDAPDELGENHPNGGEPFSRKTRLSLFSPMIVASVVISTLIALICVGIEEYIRADSEFLWCGILFIGIGSLILIWLFGLQSIKTANLDESTISTSAESQSESITATNAQSHKGIFKSFIKTSCGSLILMLSSFGPIAIAIYFLINPKDGNLNEFGLIQMWTIPVGGLIGYLFLRPLQERARWIRGFAKFCLALILLISVGTGLFIGIENYRGQRAWSNFKSEWEAKGISFDKESYLPSEIPPEKNFSYKPLLAQLQSSDGRLAHSQRLEQISAATGHSYQYNKDHDKLMRQGLVINLSGWQTHFRKNSYGWPVAPAPQTPAKDILLGLSHFKKDFERLQSDSTTRPSAHYGESELGVVPSHHSAISKLCSFLRLRMRAFLQDNQPDAALEDVRLLYFLAGTIKIGPEIDSTMLYTKLCMAGTVPIWEGLVLNKWRPEHLIEIQSILIRHDLIKTMKPALLSITMGNTLPLFKSLEGPKDQLKGFLQDAAKFNHIQLKPRGWIRQNQVYLCREVLENLLPQFDGEAHRYYPRKQSQTPPKRYSFLMSYSGLWALPALKIPEHQTQLDLLIIACSLEHHRLTKDKYPESLNSINRLDGDDLPQEVFTGHPYIYHLQHQEPGAYKLRSVGSNLKDDQGDPKLDIVWVPKGKIASRGN